MAATAPSGAPSAKEKRYDRQLRLWGASGQNRLENAHIALINATGTGTEILKNLVLPGIGQYTIIDDKLVEEADLGVNFFLDDASIGKPRAERAAALLQELNPDVKGSYLVDNLSNLLATNPALFNPASTPYTHLVVVGPEKTSTLLQLPPEIPLFLVHAISWTTVLRICSPTHPIVETHPPSLVDLRLLNPWPELSALAEEMTVGLDTPEADGGMSDHAHGHIPYALLLLKYLSDWRTTHGSNPTGYRPVKDFTAFLNSKMRTYVPGSGGSEENYEEAAAACLRHVKKAELSSDTRAVFNDPRTCGLSTDSDSFWVIARAVKDFVAANGGMLPLPGAFPDMKAESNVYVRLQNLYRAKARADAEAVLANVQTSLRALGRDVNSVSYDEVEIFCKHANFIRRVNFRPLRAEYEGDGDATHQAAIKAALESWDAEDGLVHDYIALRAWQRFYDTHNRAPGYHPDESSLSEEELPAWLESEEAQMAAFAPAGALTERGRKMVKELVRAGGAELHVTAALTGGVVSQEIVKIVTRQYVPANNTVVFDGIKGRTMVFEF